MARASRAAPSGFGPPWLQRRLAELLPQFPHVRLCVAFSGGVDSTALLAALAQLPRRPDALRAVHIDHRLQSASRRWSLHCRRVARLLQVPIAVRTARITRVPGESLEAAARAARYALLAAELAPGEALLTAHHQDDQLETVLLQLLRGAGVAGLAAMPTVAPFSAGVLARPLLGTSRAALTAWVREQGLTWVEDPSNAQLRPDRNFLRARVLPVLQERWPSAAATVSRSARHAAEAQRLLDMLGDFDVDRARSGAALSAPLLRRLSPERRRNALRFWIATAGALTPPAARLEEMAGPLLDARGDARPLVAWDGAMVRRESERLVLSPAPAVRRGATPRLGEIRWDWRSKRTRVLPPPFGTLRLESDPRGPLDLDALGGTLMLRERRGGERLRPTRGGPRRALKQLLQEAGVPPTRRAQLPLLFDRGRLIGVADLWLDESVQAGERSRRRARVLWRRSSGA
ncbi:MAG TPA: tRNA lysidine(34) synthetase TilS [Steroidobacteraceae bacterium]|nr:tRNA lysidine(34) synthetase TilS [Steroidobacteraceae bacterium]